MAQPIAQGPTAKKKNHKPRTRVDLNQKLLTFVSNCYDRDPAASWHQTERPPHGTTSIDRLEGCRPRRRTKSSSSAPLKGAARFLSETDVCGRTTLIATYCYQN
jgi:hypothetical protein